MKKLTMLLGSILFVTMASGTIYGQIEQIKATSLDASGDKVFTIVDKMPEFPGGQSALFTWIGANIEYPVEAKKAKIEGRVIAQFVINKSGHVTNATVIRDQVGHGAMEETLTLLNKMPVWNPGEHAGEKVNVLYTLPISFKL